MYAARVRAGALCLSFTLTLLQLGCTVAETAQNNDCATMAVVAYKIKTHKSYMQLEQ